MPISFHATSLNITIIQYLATIVSIIYICVVPLTYYDVGFILLGYILLSWIGNSMFFHRYVSHRSFKCHPIIKYIGVTLGSLAGKGSPIDWAAIHRHHHLHSDTDLDPHSPHREGWRLFIPTYLKYNATFNPRLVKDLLREKYYRFLQTYYILVLGSFVLVLALIDPHILIVGYIIPLAITNWLLALTVFTLHTYGEQIHVTNDNSRNNWLINIIQPGEGYHNNHHANPGSYKHGHYDLIACLITLIASKSV